LKIFELSGCRDVFFKGEQEIRSSTLFAVFFAVCSLLVYLIVSHDCDILSDDTHL
jgi:hypothetical protein